MPVRLARTSRRPSATAGVARGAGLAEVGGLAEALDQQDPGRLAVRQHVVGLVEQLEAGPGGAARVLLAGRERRDQVAERLDGAEHQVDGRVGQRLELGIGLLGVREEALQHQQQDLVADVEQVHDLAGDRVGGQRNAGVALGRPDVDRDHRPDRVEGRVGLAQLQVLVEDRDELAEVRVPPVPARALALLQDLVDGPLRRGHVGDRDQFRPAEVLLGGLRPRRPDEQHLLAELVRQVRDRRPRWTGTGARRWRSPGRAGRSRRPARGARPRARRSRTRPSRRRPRGPCPRGARGT